MSDRLAVDYAELDGFQFDSRSRGIAEWRDRKDDEAFARKCAVLKTAKWRRDNPEKAKELRAREIKSRDWKAWYADPKNRAWALARQHRLVVEAKKDHRCQFCGEAMPIELRADAVCCGALACKSAQQHERYLRWRAGKKAAATAAHGRGDEG